MVNVTHKTFNGGASALMERLKKLSSQKVCVGVPSPDDPGLTDEQKKQIEREGEGRGDIGNADLVYIHTHGVRPQPVRNEMQKEIDKSTQYSVALQMYIHEHGSFAYQVPPRPIIEPAIKNAKEDIGELLGEAAKTAVEGKDVEKALKKVGIEARDDVKDWFDNPQNGWAPNAPETIKRKKSDKPLVDTEAMRNSIVFVIRGDGND